MQRRFSVLVLAGVLAVAALFAPASAAAYSGADFRKPTDFRGGSWLGQNTQQHNSREPINVVISAKSDKRVRDNPGDYLLALTFSDCFGGQVVRANVDGSFKDQAFELRGGGCGEIFGGNHLRGWQQSGTGAWFLAVSEEHGFPWDHHIDTMASTRVETTWRVRQTVSSRSVSVGLGIASSRRPKRQCATCMALRRVRATPTTCRMTAR